MLNLLLAEPSFQALLLLLAVGIGLLITIAWFRNKQKQKWIADVRSHQDKWPEDVIRTMVAHPGKWPLDILSALMDKHWPEDIVVSILRGDLKIGMTSEMVVAAWGRPTEIQDKEVTKNGKKTRWVYGVPRKGAQYLFFTNDELTKIQS